MCDGVILSPYLSVLCVADENRVFVAGGSDGQRALASVESFDRRDGSFVLQSVAVQCDVLQRVLQCSVRPRLR